MRRQLQQRKQKQKQVQKKRKKEETEAAGTSKASSDDGSDVDYVKEKGKLVVGITEFEPMDYQNESGEWIGFDADMAKAFAESLGVDAEFVVIDWDNKILELDGKTIDCVWNGMTLTDEVTELHGVFQCLLKQRTDRDRARRQGRSVPDRGQH